MSPNRRIKSYLINKEKFGVCSKCRRVLHEGELTLHHVIPKFLLNRFIEAHPKREKYREKQDHVVYCRDCHNKIEKLYKRLKFHKRFLTKKGKHKWMGVTLGIIEEIIKTYIKVNDLFIEDKIRVI